MNVQMSEESYQKLVKTGGKYNLSDINDVIDNLVENDEYHNQ